MKRATSLQAFLCAAAQVQAVYLPVDDSKGGAQFRPWRDGMVPSTSANTVRSAKDFFFPQTESLVEFKTDGKAIQIIDVQDDPSPFVLFGVRACDCRSFQLLDRVFLAEPVDSCYARRRAAATVVTLACTRLQETCFCTNFGIDATNPGGDVAAWLVDGVLYLQENTEKGAALLAALAAVLAEADVAPVERQQAETRAVLQRLPLGRLEWPGFPEREMVDRFHDTVWEELAQSCLGCGTCTFVCPTCQCYDIRDFDTGHGVHRFRCWDSCMYSDFTKMASGNPRLTQVERFRQRFLHKLCYFPENQEGLYGCVGCGRCVAKCPVSLNIVKVARALGGGENDV